MQALDRKLLRELWQMKGQMFSIAMVVATGIMTVITMRGTYEAIAGAQASYYEEARFADIWAPIKRAPNRLIEKIEAIPGVASADTRVTFFATLDLEGLDAPAQGQFVSIPQRGRPVINDIRIQEGRQPSLAATNEVIISRKFADARDLRPGDSIRALLNGRARDLEIVGIAISPEHTYAVPPGSLYPDDERYGIFWMGRDVLAPAYDMDGAFNEALVTLSPGVNPNAVMQRLDDLLDPYGGVGSYPRDDQASHQILQGELRQNRIMGTAIPAMFLLVAAFLLNLVLGRLIATQRGEIAVLKAFGYRDVEVGRHFLTFAFVAVFAGVAIGIGAGVWLGHGYTNLYGAYFDFPNLDYRLRLPLASIAVAVSVVAAVAGAHGAVRRAASLPPAEAMRPEPPAQFHAGWLERSGVAAAVPSSVSMILRNIERKPVQSLLSAVGIAFSVAILIIGMFLFDSVGYMMDLQFRKAQREDVTLTFNEPLDAAIYYDLRHLEGVNHVETFRNVSARIHAGHLKEEVGIQGIAPDGRLRRIIASNGEEHPLPSTGIVLNERLAKKLLVSSGDRVWIEILEGRRANGHAVVAGTVRDFLGVSAYMDPAALQALVGGSRMVSGGYLSVDPESRAALNLHLKNLPVVAGVASPASMLETFQEQLADTLYIGVAFLLGFASIISIGVIYNGARISLSERGRELASLRVFGFRRSETSMLLLGEQAIITVMAIPMGWALGYVLSKGLVASLQTDLYRIPFVIDTGTYLLSALMTIAAAIASGEIVRRKVNHLDLIAVLKTRE